MSIAGCSQLWEVWSAELMRSSGITWWRRVFWGQDPTLLLLQTLGRRLRPPGHAGEEQGPHSWSHSPHWPFSSQVLLPQADSLPEALLMLVLLSRTLLPHRLD